VETIPSSADSQKKHWTPAHEEGFKKKLDNLTRRDAVLREAFEKKIRAVVENPLGVGKRCVRPIDTRHVHVKSKWVLFWRMKGDIVTLVDCGRHDEFFRD